MEKIIHNGKITSIKNNCITEYFQKHSACGSCEAKFSCALYKSQEHTADIYVENPKNYSVGQDVELEISGETGFTAVILAYIIPLILLLSTLFGVWAVNDDELTAGMSALIILIPYYLLLFSFRKNLKNNIQIKIR